MARALGTITVTGGTPKATPTARLYLAPGSEPATRTNHALVIQARKTNGAHSGVLLAYLVEGETLITGELETPELTTSFANYTFPLSEAEAQSIGSYENLEVRFQGYAITGTATVFEVADIWLQAPVGLPSVDPGSIVHTRGTSTPTMRPAIPVVSLSHVRLIGAQRVNTQA
jgi:hypothetical protein